MRRYRAWWGLLVGVTVVAALTMPAWAGVGVAAADPTPCADLFIQSIQVTPTEPVAGQPASIAITVGNDGTCAAGGFVTQFKESTTSPTGPSGSISGLGAGDSQTLTLPYTFPKSGNYEGVVQVDTGNAVQETNEANNLQIIAITVLPSTVDLQITGFTVTPVSPPPTGAVVAGETAVATITIINNGDAPVGQPFEVQWTPYAGVPPLITQVSDLGAGDSTTVTLDFTFPRAGTFTGTAVVDPNNQIAETNENNNSATFVTVVQPDLPNLLVAPQGVSESPAPSGQPSTLTVTVYNDGNADAGSFLVSWKPGPLQKTLTQQVNGLAEGATTTVTFSYTFAKAGTYAGTVTVDSSHQVKEVSETDNTAATSFTIIAAGIDLTISSVSIDPTTPTQGAAATVSITVENLGNVASPAFTTSWNPDSLGISVPSLQTTTLSMGPIGPGGSQTLTFPFTYPKAGNYRSVAKADALNVVKETNEANNEFVLNITVAPAPIDLVFTGPITVNPNPVTAGQQVTFSFGVTNTGPIATHSFFVELTPKSGGFPMFKQISGLQPSGTPGDSASFSFTTSYFAAGGYTATATIDPFNQVVEPGGGEANNVETAPVTVNKRPKA